MPLRSMLKNFCGRYLLNAISILTEILGSFMIKNIVLALGLALKFESLVPAQNLLNRETKTNEI